MALQVDKHTDIVVTVLNNLDLTRRMVESIRENTTDYQLIIVDGCSSDGTQEWLSEQEDVVAVLNTEHVSYSEGINQGFEIANTPYIGLLNNDIEVDADWLDLLSEGLDQNPSVGVIGALSTARETQWWGNYRGKHGVHVISHYLALYCCLLRREMLEEVGGYDEGFDSYGTDNDWGIRMKKAGWEQALHCDVLVKHIERATLGLTGRVEELRAAARRRLREKWPGEGF